MCVFFIKYQLIHSLPHNGKPLIIAIIIKVVQYHLVTTQKCNLQCTYCGQEEDPEIMPINLQYSINALNDFLSKDNDPVIAFYGGEPLLAWPRIKEIMDNVPAKAFMLQTNGTLLKRIPPHYLQKFHSILVSIDGRPETTNFYRGKNTYERAIAGIMRIKEKGFTGDLIARMTVSEHSIIDEEVKHLLSLDVFDHIHWQLDVMWDDDMNTRWTDFPNWVKQVYNPGITTLAEQWVSHMEMTGQVLGIVPFMGIAYTLLTKTPAKLRCGAGIDFFSITTDGGITVCPIPPSIEFAQVGSIYSSSPESIRNKVPLGDPCTSCEVLNVCGGRCLYTNKTQLWGRTGFELVCSTVKHTISVLKERIDRIRASVNPEMLRYPEIPNGVEIIP
ncbi:MAG: TIGR04084 family radical SAM/SPASM domain-containing protein [Methanobacteriota archaeon]|nr:MAG: TIGR04084 family radical SAM/SPASM domain-containing protein [Euryarchaeota archaeon]